ncbi:hypothetical protein EDB89DRAFT_1353418 [Lactarius sanguifluus]|nr:hypothetical protein EDB89DRAFT_1353418 [Lactarius sanguifluus]
MPCKLSKVKIVRAGGYSYRPAATINILPDDVFLEIFAFCIRGPCWNSIERMRVWQRLVHVCQRWRQIIYASPRYLDVHLYYCSNVTPFRKDLSRWPAFPISIAYHFPNSDDLFPEFASDDVELFAAFERPDHVRSVDLTTTTSEVEEVVALMQVSFPAADTS